jgi:hypothetical protein
LAFTWPLKLLASSLPLTSFPPPSLTSSHSFSLSLLLSLLTLSPFKPAPLVSSSSRESFQGHPDSYRLPKDHVKTSISTHLRTFRRA